MMPAEGDGIGQRALRKSAIELHPHPLSPLSKVHFILPCLQFRVKHLMLFGLRLGGFGGLQCL